MNIWPLVRKEIRHRKTGFVIGLASVVVAIASLVGSITLLKAHETRTEQILAERERETRVEMERLEDSYRMIMRDLGHNVMVLHADQSLPELRNLGHPDTHMPEEHGRRLGNGHSETLNHLLPALQEKMLWPEHELEVIISGTSGQVPVTHRTRFLTADGTAYRNPITDAIPDGMLRLGHAVAAELGLEPGHTVTLMGEEFTIERVHRHQGSHDDLMVWCQLDKAQEWLGREGMINVIFALECICEVDALGRVQADVAGILPDVQVLEFSSRVIARAEGRQRAGEEASRAIAAELDHRSRMGDARRAFAAVLVPVVLFASALWVFFVILANVREREAEIGILRAIGVNESKIVSVFLFKAVLMGLIGAVIGCLAGVILGGLWGGVEPGSGEFARLFSPTLIAGAIVVAVALCALAGWFPAMRAAHRDPADVLRKD